MTNMLILLPKLVVVIPLSGSSDSVPSPWKDQVIVNGWSPDVTMQDICAKAPESTTGDPKENGTILGGSRMKLRCQII